MADVVDDEDGASGIVCEGCGVVADDVEAAGEDGGAILYVEAATEDKWRSLVPLRVVAAIIIDDMFI